MLGRFPLGVMQGRLVPKYQGRYQAHPIGYWRDEFDRATEAGLELIEFILDFNDADKNPLLCDPKAITATCEASGVAVKSICADYFMEAPLQRVEQSQVVLEKLMQTASAIGARDIVIPCVDQSSLTGEADARDFCEVMTKMAPKAQQLGLNLSLETDLAPAPFTALLARIDNTAVTVNYDTGNSAALGFDPTEEFAAYGDQITDIHIKDRELGGGPVVLGEGACDLATVFQLIAKLKYDGPLIMQAYRDDEGCEIFQRQKDWLEENFGSILQ
jgi:L-ribulose-5-phosphate 3-epimerase